MEAPEKSPEELRSEELTAAMDAQVAAANGGRTVGMATGVQTTSGGADDKAPARGESTTT